MTTIDITVPDIGDVEDVEVIEILVSIGDQVVLDDSLITLESDKASMEIPAAENGVVTALTVAVGAKVNAGDVIGTLEVSSEATADNSAPIDKENDASGQQESSDSDISTTDSSQATSEKTVSSNDLKAESVAGATADSIATPPVRQPGGSPTAAISPGEIKKAHASPGVRRYAREHGVNLSLVSGTGNKNRVLKTDVTAFIKQSIEGTNSNYGSGQGPSSGMGIPPIPDVDFSRFGDIERVELGRINRLSASNLHRAWLNVPMVTHHDEADITDMEAFRQQLKKQLVEGEPKVTGLAFHMKALVQTLKKYPKINSSLSPDGQSLIYKKYFHIGIAVDTPNGLVVPVVRDVDKKSVTELAIDMADLSTRARGKKLKPDEMQGASMTISSLGGIGGTAFTPIVNPPEVAILGITRARMQPVWNGSEFTPRLMCPIDLSYDHRVVDGAGRGTICCSLLQDYFRYQAAIAVVPTPTRPYVDDDLQ